MKIIKILMITAVYCSVYAQHYVEPANPDSALILLKEGNNRFLNKQFTPKDYFKEIENTVASQHPYAVVLTCSDSRVPPEIIFDESIGRLFVVRIAGNVVDPAALGSIEYSVEHLGSSYLLVLGHSKCGAVTAAVKGGEFTPSIDSLVQLITPAVNKVRSLNIEPDKLIDSVIFENVYLQMNKSLTNSELLRKFSEEGKLIIGGGIYDIETGKVEFFQK